MRSPSGENAALFTVSRWPVSTAVDWPVAASQTRAVLSWDAVTTRAVGRKFGVTDEIVVAAQHALLPQSDNRVAQRRQRDRKFGARIRFRSGPSRKRKFGRESRALR